MLEQYRWNPIADPSWSERDLILPYSTLEPAYIKKNKDKCHHMHQNMTQNTVIFRL